MRNLRVALISIFGLIMIAAAIIIYQAEQLEAETIKGVRFSPTITGGATVLTELRLCQTNPQVMAHHFSDGSFRQFVDMGDFRMMAIIKHDTITRIVFERVSPKPCSDCHYYILDYEPHFTKP